MENPQKMVPQYINTKAGMNSINAEHIAKVVSELTTGTPKDLHEKELERKRSLEVASMLEKVMKFSQEDREAMKQRWVKKVEELEMTRPLQSFWAHFDFDMFYIACELLDKPEKKDLPCAVGGEGSVLCTANYAARLYGVRAAMPTFIAKKLCPELILIPPNFDKYRKFSDIFRGVLRKFDENIESHGLDEAYVNMTEHFNQKSEEERSKLIQEIREDIFNRTGLTVSCGVGANKFLAKMASEVNKPNGQFIIENNGEKITTYMEGQKIRKIYGIGPVNEYYLKGLGIETAKDIITNSDILSICFSENTCEYFLSTALGLGSIEHEFKERQSLGKSETFKPCCEKEFLETKLVELCEQVSMELEEQGFLTVNIVLSYQTENYERKDKTMNLDKFSSKKEDFLNATLNYLRGHVIECGKKIRLLGVRGSNLMKIEEWKRKNIQSFFAKQKEKEREKKNDLVEKSASKCEMSTETKSTPKSSDILSEIKSKSEFICPICNKEVQCMNNLSAFNRHIDKCLKSMK